MQLPRGTFRELKKGCALCSLIDGLVQNAFSGYCRIVADPHSITLVFEQGTILLAEYDTLQGDTAWTRLMQESQMIVDAAIHDMTASQVNLAIEFSQQARVRAARHTLKEHDRPDDRSPDKPAGMVPDGAKRVTATSSQGGDPVHPHDPAETVRAAADARDSPRDTHDPFLLKDLESLDAMDIENMAEKFRANCRLMIERLNLEHLITQKPKKEAP